MIRWIFAHIDVSRRPPVWRGGGCRHMVRVRIRWGGGAAMDTTHVHGTIHGNAGAMWSRTRSGTGRATGHGRATSPSEIRPQQSTPLSSQERLRTKPRSLYECTNLMWTDLEHIGRVLPEAAQVDMSSTNIVNRSLECSSLVCLHQRGASTRYCV